MDIFRPQTLDANKAKQIIENTHDRMRLLRRKTDEEYVKILVDEVNKYFAELDDTCVSEKDIPTKRQGPRSDKHNNLVRCMVRDVDLVKTRHTNAEELITKAVNYLSVEREGVLNSASKLNSRIVSHKLRSSLNDAGAVIFQEFFNDTGLTNQDRSTDITVDKRKSALTLAQASVNRDNSNLIDPESIIIEVDVDQPGAPDVFSNQDRFNPMYPVSNALKAGVQPIMGYGKTLDRQFANLDDNVISATDSLDQVNKPQAKNIQVSSLREGEIGGLGEMTVGEYELIWNDFVGDKKQKGSNERVNVISSIKGAISKGSRAGDADDVQVGVDSNSVFIDSKEGSSFNGASEFTREQGSDPNIPVEFYKDIKNLTLKFSLKRGAPVVGNLTRVSIAFENADGRLFIPRMDATRSSIDRARVFSPVPVSRDNDVFSTKTLVLSSVVQNPFEFSVGLKVQEADWKDITNYLGVYWELTTKRTLQGSVALDGVEASEAPVTFDGSSSVFVYHDARRAEDGTLAERANRDKGEDVFTKTINKGEEGQNVK